MALPGRLGDEEDSLLSTEQVNAISTRVNSILAKCKREKPEERDLVEAVSKFSPFAKKVSDFVPPPIPANPSTSLFDSCLIRETVEFLPPVEAGSFREGSLLWNLQLAAAGLEGSEISCRPAASEMDGCKKRVYTVRHELHDASIISFLRVITLVDSLQAFSKCYYYGGEEGIASGARCSRCANAFFFAIHSIIEEWWSALDQFFSSSDASLLRLQLFIPAFERLFSGLVGCCQDLFTSGAKGKHLFAVVKEKVNSSSGDPFAHERFLFLQHRCTEEYEQLVREVVTVGRWGDEREQRWVVAPAEFTQGERDAVDRLLLYQSMIRSVGPWSLYEECLATGAKGASISESLCLVSGWLFRLLIERENLWEHFEAFSNFYLLGKEAIFSCFLQVSSPYLSLSTHKVPVARIGALFRSCLPPGDCIADGRDVRLFVASQSYLEELQRLLSNSAGPQGFRSFHGGSSTTVSEAISLSYQVPQLLHQTVFSDSVVLKFQFLFRHLLLCWQLERAATQSSLQHPFVRHRLLTLIVGVRRYLVEHVVNPGWKKFWSFARALIDQPGVDILDLLSKGMDEFLDSSMRGCFLTNARLLRFFTRIVRCCQQQISSIDLDEFSLAVRVLIDSLAYNSSTDANRNMETLLCLINFNDFYTQT